MSHQSEFPNNLQLEPAQVAPADTEDVYIIPNLDKLSAPVEVSSKKS